MDTAKLLTHGEVSYVEGSPPGSYDPTAQLSVMDEEGGDAVLLELVWQPLLAAATLPYRKPHAMRHSYAAWMLDAVPSPIQATAPLARTHAT